MAYRRFACTFLALTLCTVGVGGAGAGESLEENSDPEAASSAEQTNPLEPDSTDTKSSEAKEDEANTVDPCRPPQSLEDPLVGHVDERLYTTVCASARWFDSFFGDARAHDEASTTFGSVSIYGKWTEHDHYETVFKGRIKIDLPNAKRKLKFFVGRLEPDEFLTDAQGVQSPAGPPQEDDEKNWMVGLGYTPLRKGSQRISFNVGIRVDWPPDPYAKVQYRWYQQFGKNLLFRVRQTGFWYSVDGLGTTNNLDLEYRPKPDALVRTSTSATVSEVTEGVRWWSSVVYFRQLAQGRAIGGRIWANGETAAPVEVSEYGAWILFRKRLHKRRLYGDIATGLTWPLDDPLETREPSWGIALGLQIQFGDVAWNPDEG